MRAALEQAFHFRWTHPLPARLPEPLPVWATPYAAMARENLLAWPALAEVTRKAATKKRYVPC